MIGRLVDRNDAERRWAVLSGPQVATLGLGTWAVTLAPWRPGPAALVLAGVSGAAGAVCWARRRGRAAGPAAIVPLVIAAVALHAAVVAAASDEAAATMATGSVVEGDAVLVADPESQPGATVALAEIDGRRFELRAAGRSSGALAGMLAGERVRVRGRVAPVAADEPWLTDRHVTGRLTVQEVTDWRPAGLAAGLANRFRVLLQRGAVSLDDGQRALLAGLLVGDDRELPPEVTDAFRAAGLTHLTAVSGQNVAFVLIVVTPLLWRLPGRARPVVVLVTLAAFTLVTRAEPSVLRAVVMAGLATTAHATGRSTTGMRDLGLAVAGLLLVDPLLGHRPGFALSVLASAGILLLGGMIRARLPGPRPFREAVAITLAAQLATAPLAAWLFGGVPLGSLPANLLAEPAAAAVMVYGLGAGTIAGAAAALGQGRIAAALHVPTSWLLTWLEGVAAFVARVDLGVLGPGALGALAAGGAALGLARRRRLRHGRAPLLRGVGAVVIGLVLLGVVTEPWRTGPERAGVALGPGATLWRAAGRPTGSGGVLVLDGRAGVASVLRDLRADRVRWLAVVVVRSPSARAAEVVEVLRGRLAVGAVIAPTGAGIPDARPPPEAPIEVDGLVLAVAASREPWSVEVTPAADRSVAPAVPPAVPPAVAAAGGAAGPSR